MDELNHAFNTVMAEYLHNGVDGALASLQNFAASVLVDSQFAQKVMEPDLSKETD
jgi:hypothetical protein